NEQTTSEEEQTNNEQTEEPAETEENKETNETDEGENSESTETEEAGTEEKYEAVDLGGRTIRIANHWDLTPQGGTELADALVERMKEVEEKYNITFEFIVIPWEEKVNQVTSSIIAGEPLADIVGLDSAQAASLIQEDYLIPLDDIVDLNDIYLPKKLQEMGTFHDKVYMFNNQLNQSGGMYYNKTMFEQAGLPDPYEQQQNGEWTWEAMLEAAKTLTTGDQYGMSADPNILAEYLISSNGGQILDTSTFEVMIDSPEAIEAYEFMASLYHEHRVIKPNEGNNWEDPRKYFSEGLVGMTQGWIWEAEGRAETSFEWGYVFWPKGPKGTDHQIPLSNSEGLTIPVGVEQPEIVYQIWEDMQLWDRSEEGVLEWFEQVMPSMEAIDTAAQMLDNISVNYWQAYNLQDAFHEMNENIATGAESPTQAVSSVKGEAQARVDEFIGKE
ncbi:extracellular solute-binding protein, partial [Gracilibacillus oryzae]